MKITRLIQSIKQAAISVVTSDTTPYPQGQANYNGKATNYIRLSPYGLDSNPKSGRFLLLLSSQGQEAVKFGLSASMTERFKNLGSDELAIYNPTSGTYFHFKQDGTIDILVTKDITEQVDGNVDISVTGNTTIDVTGNVQATIAGTLTADVTGNTELTTPLLTVNGDIQVNGDIDATGTIDGATDVLAGSGDISLKDHIHDGVQTGTSDSGGPKNP